MKVSFFTLLFTGSLSGDQDINNRLNIRQVLAPILRDKQQLTQAYSQPDNAPEYLIDTEIKLSQKERTLLYSLHDELARDHLRIEVPITWRTIQHKLPPQAVAIEFFSFQHQDNLQTKRTLYGALVLRRGYDQPKFVPLFDERELLQLITSKNDDLAPSDQYRQGPIKGSVTVVSGKAQLSIGQQLSKLIWPVALDSLLKGVKTVFYTPSGRLHEIAFAALRHPRNSNSWLSDSITLRQVLSTRILAQGDIDDAKLPQDFTAQLFGGMDYNYNLNVKEGFAKPAANVLAEKSGAGGSLLQGQDFDRLSGARKEVDSLKQLLRAHQVSVFVDTAATETQFKTLSGQSIDILHIATHGFAGLNASKQPQRQGLSGNNPSSFSNPMAESGLAMTGANYTRRGGITPVGQDDGILTAMEIADLDLSRSQFVCLSACETGLGKLQGSEGVYGLQRGFKKAGVRFLLMSLWRVKDDVTANYMVSFYRNLLHFLDIRLAYYKTQEEYRVKYHDNPQQWAAFVLVE